MGTDGVDTVQIIIPTGNDQDDTTVFVHTSHTRVIEYLEGNRLGVDRDKPWS